MFKFLKSKQNIQSVLLFFLIYSVVFFTIIYLFDDSSEEFERLERLDQEATSLAESVIRIGELVEKTRETMNERVETLLEVNELLRTNLEQRNELLLLLEQRKETLLEVNELLRANLEQRNEMLSLLEQRISPLQGMLNNTDLNSADLTVVQAEITDILQSLKRINETETAEITESTSEQSNSTETE